MKMDRLSQVHLEGWKEVCVYVFNAATLLVGCHKGHLIGKNTDPIILKGVLRDLSWDSGK